MSTSQPAQEEKPLRKLTLAEYKEYNHMAVGMEMYHSYHRTAWETLYSGCQAKKRPQGMSIKQFLAFGHQFVQGLTYHHTYEERNIFPVLAKKMPAFQQELLLLTQHKAISNGLKKTKRYLDECGDGERELRMGELKDILDSYGPTLWQHLEDEVHQLGAENMQKYWTLEEMKRMPM